MRMKEKKDKYRQQRLMQKKNQTTIKQKRKMSKKTKKKRKENKEKEKKNEMIIDLPHSIRVGSLYYFQAGYMTIPCWQVMID